MAEREAWHRFDLLNLQELINYAMDLRSGILALCVSLGLFFPSSFAGRLAAADRSPDCPRSGDDRVANLLCSVRAQHRIPAMAAAVVTSAGVVESAAVGVRKAGLPDAVTSDDLWHLGSDTKAMTATLVARLVERGQLKWGSTVEEVFPELAGGFNAQLRKLNLRHLLSHHAGLEANLNWSRIARSGGTIQEQRLTALKEAMETRPKHAPGTLYHYSNLGYVVVGAMVERVTGKSWEQAMREEIFGPLEMKSAGFGGVGTPGRLDQPWGHRKPGYPVPEYGPEADNPPVIGPAGTVHSSLQDWARFIADHLRGLRGEAGLLQPATYQELVKPPFGGEYGLGWAVVERPWSDGIALNHCGCNTMYFANAWLAPSRDLAFLVTANLGLSAFDATDAAIQGLVSLRQPGGTAGGAASGTGGATP